jgi:hypothetical protein
MLQSQFTIDFLHRSPSSCVVYNGKGEPSLQTLFSLNNVSAQIMTLFCDHLRLAESVLTLSAYTRHRKEIVHYISEGRKPHLANFFPPGLVVSRTL